MKKLLVVGVIVLFLGLAIAPSINANVSKASIESELVEITTEVCGINGVKPNTVSLSKEDAEEKLIDDIERRLDNVETREETVEIFNEAVVELDKYGLLGGLSVKQAQRLVTGGYQNLLVKRIFGNIFHKYIDNFDNVICLISGETSETRFIRPILRFLYGMMSIVPVILLPMFMIIGLIDIYFGNTVFSPLKIGGCIAFGSYDYYRPSYTGAKGWLHTNGMSGIKDWEGSFRGLISSFHHIDHIVYVGVVGFIGIKLFKEFDSYYYLGSALGVKVRY